VAVWKQLTGRQIGIYVGDLCDADFTFTMMADFEPDAVVHYAEQRAAPYSMVDRKHAVYTQTNNVVGTLNVLYAIAEIDPDIHLVKLGTMGEYGTPDIDIEEGWLLVEHNGRTDRVLYPKRPGSFYHLSKVHDSHNIEFACRIWGIRATDLNQGVVYGQAVPGVPLTVYGNGDQTRGLVDIRDPVRCIQLACESPAERGEFRVFNQLTQTMSVLQIAETIAAAFGEPVTISTLDNPRVELEERYYNVVYTGLADLGLHAHALSDTLIESLVDITKRYAHRARPEAMLRTIQWRATSSVISN